MANRHWLVPVPWPAQGLAVLQIHSQRWLSWLQGRGTWSITLAVCLDHCDRNMYVLQAHECACLQKEKQLEPAKIMRWRKLKESFELSSRLLSIISNYTSLHLPKQNRPSQHWKTHCFICYSRMFAGKHVNSIPLASGSMGFLTLLDRIDAGWKDYAVLQLPTKVW